MATLSPPRPTNVIRPPRRASAHTTPLRPRRELSVVLIGVLLVLAGALAFTDTSLHLGGRQNVLVTTTPLSAGTVLSPSDLTTTALSGGSGVAFIAAAEEATVIGHPLSIPLAAGVPVTASEIGAPSSAIAGSDVVALLLKPGDFPPALSSGAKVDVIPVPSAGSSTLPSSDSPFPATVLSVDTAPNDANDGSVITLQVAASLATAVAQLAAAGEASLIQLGTS